MKIRPASKADAAQMHALAQLSDTAAHWRAGAYSQIFDEPGRAAFVAESERGIIGLLVVNTQGRAWEIENLVVRTAERRHGVASQLLEAMMRSARASETTEIMLEVRESNAAARALYGRFGYVEAGRRRAYYSWPLEDAVLLTFSLH